MFLNCDLMFQPAPRFILRAILQSRSVHALFVVVFMPEGDVNDDE